jgi:hypothetical protein
MGVTNVDVVCERILVMVFVGALAVEVMVLRAVLVITFVVTTFKSTWHDTEFG